MQYKYWLSNKAKTLIITLTLKGSTGRQTILHYSTKRVSWRGDFHKLRIMFGQVNVTNRTSDVDLQNYLSNGEWELLDASLVREEITYSLSDEPFTHVTVSLKWVSAYLLSSSHSPPLSGYEGRLCTTCTTLSSPAWWCPPSRCLSSVCPRTQVSR